MTTFTSKPFNLVQSGALIAVKLCPSTVSVSTQPPITTLAEINTSSMRTYIQEGIATSLGLQPIQCIKISTSVRPDYESYAYRIRLLFPDDSAVEVNAIEIPYMIRLGTRIKCMIGRDILQFCVLTYDGRANAVTLDLQTGK